MFNRCLERDPQLRRRSGTCAEPFRQSLRAASLDPDSGVLAGRSRVLTESRKGGSLASALGRGRESAGPRDAWNRRIPPQGLQLERPGKNPKFRLFSRFFKKQANRSDGPCLKTMKSRRTGLFFVSNFGRIHGKKWPSTWVSVADRRTSGGRWPFSFGKGDFLFS
jgi:hypothetical protein